ncbi:MAG: HemK/PrmC family methyltransferase, partial [Dokdonella sp.]
MSDLRSLLNAAMSQIDGDEARADVEILAMHALDKSRAWLFAHADYVATDIQAEWFARLVAARASGEPIAYLTGRRGFRKLDLAVTPDVLIPRPETELLVELALDRIPVDAEFRIADLGTGSGAIGLAIARERPHANILATDASEVALVVARENADRIGIDNVDFER